MAGVALLQLLVVRDGRAPLMVADEHGVRVRHGETWSGLRWQDIENIEVTSPTSWLRDGQVVVHPRVVSAEEALLASLAAADEQEGPDDESATDETPQAERSTEAYVVPLARTTRVEFDGLSGDLVAALDALASGRVPVLVLTKLEPEKAPKEKAEKAEKAPKPEKAPKEKVERAPKPEKAPKAEKLPHRCGRRSRRRHPRPRNRRSCRSCRGPRSCPGRSGPNARWAGAAAGPPCSAWATVRLEVLSLSPAPSWVPSQPPSQPPRSNHSQCPSC